MFFVLSKTVGIMLLPTNFLIGVGVVGILDDRGLLHHQIKLFGGMPAAAVILLATGIRAQVFSEYWPGTAAVWADTALTLVWVVGITASFSILDHMDGLCAGIAAVASLFFAIFALESGQLLVSTMSAAVFGARRQDEAPACVDAGVVYDRKARLAAAGTRVSQSPGAEPAHRPCGRTDQPKHDQECQEEAYGERHLRSQQTVHPHYSPFRLGARPSPKGCGPQRLTAPEILAAVITNKQLKIIAEFGGKADG